MENQLILKIKQSGLAGRGGACFPTWLKWQAMLEAKSKVKYLVCNGAEGERGARKDKFILMNYPEDVIEGMRLALKNLKINKGYIYLKPEYYDHFYRRLRNLVRGLNIEIIKKTGGYLAGEETMVCNVIEGKPLIPRLKPPYPTTAGIEGKPTLINNVETLYHVAQIDKGEYSGTRFYSINGEAKNPGVFELSEHLTMDRILKETGNYPHFKFFVQVGGGWSGSILLPEELSRGAYGGGAIMVYKNQKKVIDSLMVELADFFVSHNCDKCVPCREGSYRLYKMIKARKIDELKFKDLVNNLEQACFCPYGAMLAQPLKDIFNKLISCPKK